MNVLLSVYTGMLFGVACYMLLRRSLTRVIIGIILLGQAANLAVFLATGLSSRQPPLIDQEQDTLAASAADPLPQALVLTAIVISFGIAAFSLMLFKRTYRAMGSDDIKTYTGTDKV